LSRIREEYVASGKVRFVYKHFAILGPESNRTAEASECAAEQDSFWEFHDLIFADQVANRSQLNDENLVRFAGQIGLDTETFDECLTSGRYRTQISQESLSVQSLGVRGTPAFLVNGVFISGAQPFEVFQQVIEEQLQAIELAN
jgi:protein-disulfide isomerase